MARKCKYYLNGMPSDLYTELYGYMDTVAPEKKTSEQVYKILKNRLNNNIILSLSTD